MVVQLGTPAESIAEFASHAGVDLIVMSTHGTTSTGRVRHTLGSTTVATLWPHACLLATFLLPIRRGYGKKPCGATPTDRRRDGLPHTVSLHCGREERST
jgi:hypothetical protein